MKTQGQIQLTEQKHERTILKKHMILRASFQQSQICHNLVNSHVRLNNPLIIKWQFGLVWIINVNAYFTEPLRVSKA